MTDKLQGGIKAGSTSLSLSLVLRRSTDSSEFTGRVPADMTLSYWRQGGEMTAVSASTLTSASSSYGSGGFKEVNSANMPGLYRVDWPDAAFATGADWVHVAAKTSGAYVFHERYPLTGNVIQSGDSYPLVSAVDTKTSATYVLVSAIDTKVSATSITVGTINTNVTTLLATTSAIDAATSVTRINVNNLITTVSAVATDASASVVKLNSLLTTVSAIDTAVSATKVLAGTINTNVNALITTVSAVATDVSAVRVKTNSLTFSSANRVDATVLGLTAGGLKDYFLIDSGTGYTSSVSGSVVKEISDHAGGSGLTVQSIVDGVWNEAVASHTSAPSFGKMIQVIDTNVSSNKLTLSAVNADTSNIRILTSAIDASVSAVKVKTNQLTFSSANRVDATTLGMTAGSLKDFFLIDSGTGYTSSVSGSVVKETADHSGGSALTVQAIVNGVWDEAVSLHTSAPSFGKMVQVVDTNVSANKITLAALTATVSAVATDASAAKLNTSSIITTLSAVDTAVSATKVLAGTINTNLNSLITTVSAVATDVSATRVLAGTINTNVNALTTSVSAIATDASASVVKLNSLITSVSAVSTDASASVVKLNSLITTVSAIDTATSATKVLAGTINTNVNSLVVTLSAVDTAVSATKVIVNTINTNVSAVTTDVSAIRVKTNQMVFTVSNQLDSTAVTLGNAARASVHTEVVSALATDTYGEPTGAPGATTSLVVKIGRLYQVLRNQVTVSAGAKTFYDDSGAALWSKTLADDGSLYTENEGS